MTFQPLMPDTLKMIQPDDRINQLEIERDEAKAALSEEKRIVDRVWNALGISTYEQAKPLAIDEHVKSLLDRLQAVEKERDRYRTALEEISTLREGAGPAARAWSTAIKALQPAQKEQQ